MDASAYFRDKKITVMGLGLLGRGIGDVRYLASCGAHVLVTDLKSADVLAPALAELKEYPQIQYVLGEHRLEDFRTCDMVLKAAGVPSDSVYIAEARAHNIPIKMSASLFAELAQIPVIGVTGTRGKSTTTHMLHAILEHARRKVVLGGNVRGVSTLALLPEVTPEHIALFELDSWQLQGFGDLAWSPQLAIFTTFYPDHLNYYHNDLAAYMADKAHIFLYQKPEDTLVLGAQCAAHIQGTYAARIVSRVVVAGEHDLPNEWTLKVLGAHNRYDAALALAAARAWGVEDGVSREALEHFEGVPGRLELVQTIDGVDFYNDTTSTTPEATTAAIAALQEKYAKCIVLIMGGSDKALDMNALLEIIPSHTKHVVLLAGTGTERIHAILSEAPMYSNLSDALVAAKAHAESGDAILFSPAFASFGMFKNEFDRGDQFTALVKKL